MLRRGDLLDGLMRLVNFHLGGSLYVIPMIMKEAGPKNASILLAVCASLTWFVYFVLGRLVICQRSGSLTHMVATAMGRPAAILLRLLIVLNALGVVSAYIQTSVDIYATTPIDARYFFGLILLCGSCSVLALERSAPNIADWGSLLANGALVVIIVAFLWLPPSSAALPAPMSFFEMVGKHGPSVVFAFSSAEYVLFACGICDDTGKLVEGMHERQVCSRVHTIGPLSLSISFLLYLCVGHAGIRAFGAGVQEDVLKNFGGSTQHPILNTVVLATNALSLILSFPVFAETLLLYTRELLQTMLPPPVFERHIEPAPWLNPAKPFCGCSWIVPLAGLICYRAAGLKNIIDLMSSCTDYAFMFVFPSFALCLSCKVSDMPLIWMVCFLLGLLATKMGTESFFVAWAATQATSAT